MHQKSDVKQQSLKASVEVVGRPDWTPTHENKLLESLLFHILS